MNVEWIKDELDGKIYSQEELLKKFPNAKIEKKTNQFVIGEGTPNSQVYTIVTTNANILFYDFKVNLTKVEQYGKINDIGPFYVKGIH